MPFLVLYTIYMSFRQSVAKRNLKMWGLLRSRQHNLFVINVCYSAFLQTISALLLSFNVVAKM